MLNSRRNILKVLSFVPAILLLCFIFMMSDNNGEESSSLSFFFAEHYAQIVASLFYPDATSDVINQIALDVHFYIRKLAHITEFFCLVAALLLPVEAIRGRLSPRALALTFLIAIAAAALDEFHQSFIEGRVGTPTDVLVDSIGIILAMITAYILHIINKRRREAKANTIGK